MRTLVVCVVVVSSFFMGCAVSPCKGSACREEEPEVPTPKNGPEACEAVKGAELDFYERCVWMTEEYAAHRRAMLPAQCATSSWSAAELAGAPACVKRWRGGGCNDFITCPETAGSGANGASCFASSDCLADLYCDTRSSCPGVCTPRVPLGETVIQYLQECVAGGYAYGGVCRPYVAEGASCAALSGAFFSQSCQEGLVCTAAEVCTKTTYYAGLDEPCGPQRACSVGLRCAGATCARRLTAGGLCGGPGECLAGLSCVAGRCEPHIGKAGATCEAATFRSCDIGLFCNRPGSTTVGTCAPLRGTGAACEEGSQCAVGLFCAATDGALGECRTRLLEGDGCLSSDVCGDGLYCSYDNRCTPQKAAGVSCESSDECQSSTCDSGLCTSPSCSRR